MISSTKLLAKLICLIGTVCVVSAVMTEISFSSEKDPCFVAYWDGTKTNEFDACQKAAQSGDADSEYGFGLLLFSGHNRKNDREAGLEWMRKSARQGHQLARAALGVYLSRLPDDEVHRNLVEGYAWFSLAGEKTAATKLETRMSSSELVDAKKLASEYLAKYGKSEPLIRRIPNTSP